MALPLRLLKAVTLVRQFIHETRGTATNKEYLGLGLGLGLGLDALTTKKPLGFSLACQKSLSSSDCGVGTVVTAWGSSLRGLPPSFPFALLVSAF